MIGLILGGFVLLIVIIAILTESLTSFSREVKEEQSNKSDHRKDIQDYDWDQLQRSRLSTRVK